MELLVALDPPAALDELEDEHAAAVRDSSKTAVAPAAGFAKDRFIPVSFACFFGFGCRSCAGSCVPADRHVQLLATSRKHTR